MKFFLFLVFSLSSWAQQSTPKSCVVEAPYYLYQFSSVLTGQKYPYITEKRSSQNMDTIGLGQCQQESQKRRLLMIGVGADFNGVYSDTVSASYNDELIEDSCQVTSTLPIKPMLFAERKKNFSSAQKAINKCALMSVVDRSGGALTFVQGPSNECRVEQLGRSEAVIYGRGVCFLRLYNTTQIEIKMDLDTQCTDQKFLGKNAIDYGDYYGRVNLFTVADASSRDTSLTPLKSVPFRLTVEGDGKVFPLAESIDSIYPRWPSEYPMPDVFFGEVVIKKYAQNLNLKIPYLVDNRCPVKCVKGNCGSTCGYATPLSSTLSLMEWNGQSGKWEEIDSWYDGAIVAPQWQGLLMGKTQQSMQYIPVAGKKYKLLASFADPKEDFIFFHKKLFASSLRFGNSRISALPLDSGAQIPTINSMANGQTMPELSSLPSYARGAQVSGMAQEKEELSSMLDYNVWPADYSKVCNPRNGICENISGKVHTTLELEFQLKLKDDGETFELVNATQKRVSSVLSSKEKSSNFSTKVECPTQYNP